MKKYLIFILTCIFIYSAQAQDEPLYACTLSDFGLKGKVKSVEQHCYEAVSENGSFKKGENTGYDNLNRNCLWLFSPDGVAKSRQTFSSTGKPLFLHRYEYENGRLSKIVHQDGNEEIFSYGKDGNLSLCTQTIRNKVFDTHKYVCNDKGEVIKESKKRTKQTNQYEYMDGKRVKMISRGESKFITEYVYDENGHLKQVTENGKVFYEYPEIVSDEQGNWTKLILKNSKFNTYFILERQLNYYE